MILVLMEGDGFQQIDGGKAWAANLAWNYFDADAPPVDAIVQRIRTALKI
jgi:hypothetical protein